MTIEQWKKQDLDLNISSKYQIDYLWATVP